LILPPLSLEKPKDLFESTPAYFWPYATRF
jgi:hypothetical protein